MEACPADRAVEFRETLTREIGPERFQRCFAGQVAFDCRDGQLGVAVASEFYAGWIRRNFQQEFERAAHTLLGPAARISFRVDAAALESAASSATAGEENSSETNTARPSHATNPPSRASALRQTTLPFDRKKSHQPSRRFARFDLFIPGDANRVALAQCQLVADQPGAVTPLLVHGPTGVGKTHLLEAGWSAFRRAHPKSRAIYLTAEDFTAQFTQAVCRGGMPAFRGKYRGLHFLALDDLHFLLGKDKTIVEFVHTIDRLREHGAQILLASDRSLTELAALGPELVSRLAGGLDCAIKRPDFDLRLQLVDAFATKSNLSLPAPVTEHVARTVAGDVRMLQGAVHRLAAVHRTLDQRITLAVARRAVEDLSVSASTAVRLPDIERAVCDSFGIEPETLHSATKSRHASQPRMLAMWLARKYTPAALSEIGHYFGRRSHTTVISAEKRLDRLIAASDTIRLADETIPVDAAIRRVEQRLSIG